MADFNLCKRQGVGEVANAPQEIVHNKNKSSSNPSGVKKCKVGSSFKAVHYQPSSENLENGQTLSRQCENEKHLKKGWRGNVQQPAKFMEYTPATLEILKRFERMWDIHQERINVVYNRTDLVNENIRLAHSELYRSWPIIRKSSAAEGSRMITKRVTNGQQQNSHPRLSSLPRNTAFFSFASTIGNSVVSPSVIRTTSLAWTNISTAWEG